MSLKFYDNRANLFGKLLQIKDIEKVREIIKKEFLCSYPCNYYMEEDKKRILKTFEDELQEVKVFFDKIKFFEKPEIYSVNSWGYEQSNYENLKVLGEIANSVVCVLDKTYINYVWVVSKKKFKNKEYTKLDDVRRTNWKTPYTDEEIWEQNLYNAYCGY